MDQCCWWYRFPLLSFLLFLISIPHSRRVDRHNWQDICFLTTITNPFFPDLFFSYLFPLEFAEPIHLLHGKLIGMCHLPYVLIPHPFPHLMSLVIFPSKKGYFWVKSLISILPLFSILRGFWYPFGIQRIDERVGLDLTTSEGRKMTLVKMLGQTHISIRKGEMRLGWVTICCLFPLPTLNKSRSTDIEKIRKLSEREIKGSPRLSFLLKSESSRRPTFQFSSLFPPSWISFLYRFRCDSAWLHLWLRPRKTVSAFPLPLLSSGRICFFRWDS